MPALLKDRQDALVRRRPQWIARTLHEELDAAAESFAERPYVVTDEFAWSYADVKSRSETIAAGLMAAGVRAGDHVAMVLANYPDFVALKYAISRVGATCVPINFLNRRDELGYVLKQSDAAFLVTMDRFRDLDYLAALDALMPGWEKDGGGVAFPRLKRVVVFPTGDEPVRAGAADFTQFLAAGSNPTNFPEVDPQSVSDIIYMSGTTGAPKGVMLMHDMLLRAAFGSAYCRGFDDGWRVTFSLPMYHVYGYVEGLLTVPFVGGAIIPQVQFNPAETLRAIEAHEADDVLLVPTMTSVILDELRARPRKLPSLWAVISSGQRSPQGILREIFDLMTPDEVTTGYGMTELTATTMATRVDDPETGKVLGPGEVGELMAKGPGVTKGYYNKPDATAEAFDAEGWLHTGDLARFDDDGYMTLVGRRKESYRCGGEQVMPTEIEDVVTRIRPCFRCMSCRCRTGGWAKRGRSMSCCVTACR